MYSPNILAHLIIRGCRTARTLTAEQRTTLATLHPRTSGMVWCLVALALRYYSVEVG